MLDDHDSLKKTLRLMPRKDSAVWIVVPTLNEAKNIAPLLNSIEHEMRGVHCVVCVVDDGSRDGTVSRARAFEKAIPKSNPTFRVYVLERKKGHRGSQRGGAVLTGLKYGLDHSPCNIFVEMDADLAHRPEELKLGISAIEERGYNVVIASKYLPGSRVLNRPLKRRILSFLFNWLMRRFITSKIGDFSNGFRFYDSTSARLLCETRIRYTSPIYLGDALTTLLASELRVTEFPSIYVERKEGSSKLSLIDILKAGVALPEITLRYHLAKNSAGR